MTSAAKDCVCDTDKRDSRREERNRGSFESSRKPRDHRENDRGRATRERGRDGAARDVATGVLVFHRTGLYGRRAVGKETRLKIESGHGLSTA